MLKKIKLIFATIKYLKPVQLKYQFLYRLKKVKRLKHYEIKTNFRELTTLSFDQETDPDQSYLGRNRFKFLNLEYDFGREINWNEQKFGKLWNYNLQYGNYLLQKDVSVQKKIDLLTDLYNQLSNGNLLLEPYPVSLRSINVIRLASSGVTVDNKLLRCLCAELSFLSQRLEFHILGNHLLENAFAMAMGGAFFGNGNWLRTGMTLIIEQLEEQILPDGAHFELSPMYHQIILFRVLECFDWYSKYVDRNEKTLTLIGNKAASMLSWLVKMTFQNGDIPLFNDSANGIAYSTEWLLNYGRKLQIPIIELYLKESGYRSVNRGRYECRIDFAQVGASYQAGHSHADALSFILYYDNKPLFVEQGTSTYQISKRRELERSTQAHNTVELKDVNQSEVWGGFRTAHRAQVHILKDGVNVYSAWHNGYERKFNVRHTRTFIFSDKNIEVWDKLSKKSDAKCYFHLHPGVTIDVLNENEYLLNGEIKISFKGASKITVNSYQFANSYNQYLTAQRFVVSFEEQLCSILYFED
ncbi:alginate lyase family protein [Sphingobacterium thalpophilum]|uniref:alginate lyase family protein n=1 Tax=Sphingobacterium thalpophilum TaxID=259 RepID=UPI0031DD03AD